MPDPEQFADVAFPQRGIDLAPGFGSQSPLTCREGANVRFFDPATNRGRGAARPGLVQHIPAQVGGGRHLVQHLNYVVDPQAEAIPDYDPPRGSGGGGGSTGGANPGGDPFGGTPSGGPGTYADPTETTPGETARNPYGRVVRYGGTGTRFTRRRRGIRYIQSNTKSWLGGPVGTGPYSVAFTSAVKKKSLLIVFVANYFIADTLTASLADTQGNAYHQIGAYHYDGVNTTLSMWFAYTEAAGANTVTMTNSTTPTDAVVTVLEYAGTKPYDVVTGFPVDSSNWSTYGGPSVPSAFLLSIPSIVVNADNEAVVACFAAQQNEIPDVATFAPTSPYANVITNDASHGIHINTRVFVIHKLPTSGDTAPSGVETSTLVHQYVGMGAGFRPA